MDSERRSIDEEGVLLFQDADPSADGASVAANDSQPDPIPSGQEFSGRNMWWVFIFWFTLLFIGVLVMFVISIVDGSEGLTFGKMMGCSLFVGVFALLYARDIASKVAGWREKTALVAPAPDAWMKALPLMVLAVAFALVAHSKIIPPIFPVRSSSVKVDMFANGVTWPVFCVYLVNVLILSPLFWEFTVRGIGLAGYLRTGSKIRAIFWTTVASGGTTLSPGFIGLGVTMGYIRLRSGSLYCCIATAMMTGCIEAVFFYLEHMAGAV